MFCMENTGIQCVSVCPQIRYGYCFGDLVQDNSCKPATVPAMIVSADALSVLSTEAKSMLVREKDTHNSATSEAVSLTLR